jgi:hypothetical protein
MSPPVLVLMSAALSSPNCVCVCARARARVRELLVIFLRSVRGLQLIVYEALSYYCMRP